MTLLKNIPTRLTDFTKPARLYTYDPITDDDAYLLLPDLAPGIPSELNQGESFTYLGSLLNESFTGTTLNASNWSGVLPTGASINNKLIIASGLNDWSRYIQLASLKACIYEKLDIIIDFKAVTKNAGDGWGLTQSNILSFYNSSAQLKFNQETGRITFDGNTSQEIDFVAGDDLRMTIKRKPSKTIIIIENVTTPATSKILFEVKLSKWGTGGYLQLAFLGGQQEFANITISSTIRDYQGVEGVVFIGDSITNGGGASLVINRFTNVLMKNQQHLYENLGVNAWISGALTSARVNDLLSLINAKYLVVSFGYNDKSQSISTLAYQTNLETIATIAQGLGYEVIFVSPWPDLTSTNASYVTAMQSAAANTLSKFVNISSAVGFIADNKYIDDSVHPNDEGHELIATSIDYYCPELFADIQTDIDNEDILFRNLGYSNEIIPILGIDQKGRAVKLNPSNYANKNTIRLQQSLYRSYIPYLFQPGSFGITGIISNNAAYVQQAAGQGGLRIGFNDGLATNTATNIQITNKGIGGAGYPQAWSSITGDRNILLSALSNKGGYTLSISGSDNTILGSIFTVISGSRNVILGNTTLTLSSGNDNIFIGTYSGKAITTGSSNIIICNKNTGSFAGSNVSNIILIGEYHMDAGNTYASGDVILNAGYYTATNLYVGGKENSGIDGTINSPKNRSLILQSHTSIKVNIGTTPTNKLTISSALANFQVPVLATQFKLSALNTAPASASDTGTTGDIRFTSDSLYLCISTNTWVKATLATF